MSALTRKRVKAPVPGMAIALLCQTIRGYACSPPSSFPKDIKGYAFPSLIVITPPGHLMAASLQFPRTPRERGVDVDRGEFRLAIFGFPQVWHPFCFPSPGARPNAITAENWIIFSPDACVNPLNGKWWGHCDAHLVRWFTRACRSSWVQGRLEGIHLQWEGIWKARFDSMSEGGIPGFPSISPSTTIARMEGRPLWERRSTPARAG